MDGMQNEERNIFFLNTCELIIGLIATKYSRANKYEVSSLTLRRLMKIIVMRLVKIQGKLYWFEMYSSFCKVSLRTRSEVEYNSS